MKTVSTLVAAGAVALSVIASPSEAQSFDPTPTLQQVISAFQVCGPPQVFQAFSPQLFQAVFAQTGGSGCYRDIALAGAVVSAQVVDQRMFPVGPLYLIRVRHQTGAVADWFIGFNQFTSKIEFLNYQTAAVQTPTVGTGPTAPTSGPSPTPLPTPTPATGQGDGCDLYPAMCQ